MSSKSLKPRQSVTIASRRIAPDECPYIVAEMSCSHQGNVDEAIALVDAAAMAKADAIQFEIFDADDNISPEFPNAELIRTLQLSPAEWERVFARAREKNIATIAYVYDGVSYDFAKHFKPDAYKLNSSDLSNPYLLEALAKTGLPFTLGTGASDFAEIGESLNYALEHGGDQVVLMHGVQSFPTQVADANINRLKMLQDTFGTLVGYADHTNGADARSPLVDLIAMGAGASILEKHICAFRGEDRIDSQSSLEPDEFAAYVRQIRDLSVAMGDTTTKPFTSAELNYRRFQKKTAVSRVDISKGHILTNDDMVFLRHSEVGMSPMNARNLLGRAARNPIRAGTALQESDFL